MATSFRVRLLCCVFLALQVPDRAGADAIVWTRAMLASTVVEYFVEEGRVLVELEIGPSDLSAFRNLLPDPVYEKLGSTPLAFDERLKCFFEHDFAIAAGDGPPLPGRILEIGPRARVVRDEITGEPMEPAEGEPAETVVFARLEYALPGKSATLTLFGARGPTTASVGFVAYHRDIAVNDFRYLAPSQTLQLDWEDPWYTRFEARALRRRYFAPMSGFLYIEPYEVRKEIIVRPRDLQQWVDLGLDGRETIPAEIQPELKRKVAEFLRGHQKVLIDGREIEPDLARINFLGRTLRTSRVIDPPVELDVYSALLGVIFVYPVDGLPEHVTMEWDLWSARTPLIPVSAVDQAGGLPSYLEPDWRVLEWKNFLKNPKLPTLHVLVPPPGPLARSMQTLRWLLLLGSVGTLLWAVRGRAGSAALRALASGAALLATAGGFWLGHGARLTDERATHVVGSILHNIYRAFDFRDEAQIYDVLAKSAEGDLLSQIYLETRRGLELASQGGARAKVKEIKMIDLDATPAAGGGFSATATWNVAGSVGHWGHVHERRNQYRAKLAVTPVDGVWKLIGLEILQEERL